MEETIVFLVQGSAKEPYEVKFLKKDQKITATCTCQAGRFSGHCKHRVSILTNKPNDIVSENIEDVQKISSWIANTEIENALNHFIQMQELEKKAKSETKKAKKIFEKIISK